MNPQHGVPEQNTTIPYQLIPEVESVSAGETVQLTLNKTDAEAIADFKGIMIEAVNVEDETIVGRFEERWGASFLKFKIKFSLSMFKSFFQPDSNTFCMQLPTYSKTCFVVMTFTNRSWWLAVLRDCLKSTSFQYYFSSSTKVIDCNDNGNAATHNDNSDKKNVTLNWIAPEVMSDVTVRFVYTVVQTKEVLWVKKEANIRIVVKPATSESTQENVEPDPTTKANDTSQPTKENDTPQPTIAENEKRPIVYESTVPSISSAPQGPSDAECGNSKGCFGNVDACVTSGNCNMMTSYKYSPEKKAFEVTLIGNEIESGMYVAVGLSSDASMGEDLVFYCGNGFNVVKVSWNEGHSGSKSAEGVEVLKN